VSGPRNITRRLPPTRRVVKFKANHILILVVLLMAGTAGLLFAINNRLVKKSPAIHSTSAPHIGSLPERPGDSRSYNEVRAGIEAERIALSSRYRKATNPAQKVEIINRARDALTQSISTELFPFWYGTAWDFNGTTETPGQGKIACGYFVSTVLRDSGLRVERAKLAQQASENIILSLTREAQIKRFRRAAISDFVDAVKQWGPGLYVIGLDIHTGFIINISDEVYFIHSSYIGPFAVVRERAIESKILSASKYRVIGKVLADDQLIMKWLMGEEVATRSA